MKKIHQFFKARAEHCKKSGRANLQTLPGVPCLVCLLCLLSLILPRKAHAIPSYTRQTGFSCDECHTVYPNLTPFGRDFKLHGYTMTASKTIKSDASSNSTPLMNLNNIPMVSARIVSMWSNQAGGNNGIVPKGITTAGQGFMSFPSGYNDKETFNLVGDSSIYVSGKIAPYMGTFLEFSGIDDEGGTLGLGMLDTVIVAPDTMLGGRSFVYGIRGVDAVFTGDPSNVLGTWGLTSQLMGMSTHNTLYDPNRAMVEGGELYGMWGGFNNGGLFGTVAFYHPTGSQTAGSFVQGNLAGLSGTPGTLNTSSVDEAVRLAYYLPSFGNLYTEIGASAYFGKEGMIAPSAASIPNPYYNDNYSNYGVDAQVQYIGDKNLAELFAIYQSQNDNKFYGQDLYSNINYGVNGTSVQRNALAVTADYYYKRTYGAYVKYLYQNSDKVKDMNVAGTILGLSWFPWENVQVILEQALFGTYNPGLAQYANTSLSPSDFNVTSVKLEYLF
jgi:hypothetical protein